MAVKNILAVRFEDNNLLVVFNFKGLTKSEMKNLLAELEDARDELKKLLKDGKE